MSSFLDVYDARSHRRWTATRWSVAIGLVLMSAMVIILFTANSGQAVPLAPTPPTPPVDPVLPADGLGGVSLQIGGPNGGPSSSIITLLGVLAITRNALALPSIPPNQVLAGLALFLTLFIMGPVILDINNLGIQPYLRGTLSFTDALDAASVPLRHFMLAHTKQEDLALMTRSAGMANPATPNDVPLLTLIPAFMISELRSAFIIGFVVFVPFLVIDLVVSAALMSMGMMMLPPVMISLPFKILLFVLVDGWGLIITSLINSYRGG